MQISGLERALGRVQNIMDRFVPPPAATAPGPESDAAGLNPEVAQTALRTGFGAELDRMIEAESLRQGVAPDLVRAIVQVESGGRVDARSRAGAIGLMQLMPGTATSLGVDPEDPAQNLAGGVRYLRDMAAQFGDLDRTLAAYNAGPGAVRRFNGVPPYAETQNYIQSIRQILDERG